MDPLRDNELIYGRLLPAEEPNLIERGNGARLLLPVHGEKVARRVG